MRDGPRGFDQGSSCPGLLRVPDITDMVARRGLSPSPAPLSSGVPLPITRESLRPYYPGPASTDPVWAPPRSIATTWGITVVFFSSRYLDVSVRGVGSPLRARRRFTPPGCPIRKPQDHRIFAPPQGLSQLVTSFFASESPGIHRTPLSTSFQSFFVLARPRLTHGRVRIILYSTS